VGEENGKREKTFGTEGREKESGIPSSLLIFFFPLFPLAGYVVSRSR
jgi:hypothetical protein